MKLAAGEHENQHEYSDSESVDVCNKFTSRAEIKDTPHPHQLILLPGQGFCAGNHGSFPVVPPSEVWLPLELSKQSSTRSSVSKPEEGS